jgi:membrane protease subunit HflC
MIGSFPSTWKRKVIPDDDRRLIGDAFARYGISDVVQFRQATGGGEQAKAVADRRLEDILRAATADFGFGQFR